MTTQTEIWTRGPRAVKVAKAVVRDDNGRFVGVTNKTKEVLLTK